MPTDDDISALYRELVLEHAREPRNFGRIDDATHSAAGINPLCGDKLQVYAVVDADSKLCAVKFEGSGCAISMASASLMTDNLESLPVESVATCIKAITERLQSDSRSDASSDAPIESDPEGVDLSALRALDGVKEFPSRIKCATLPWRALQAALDKQEQPATTE